MFKSILINSLLFLAISSTPVVMGQDNFLLSGRIKAKDNQTFYSPKTDSWQVQVQWLLPEGDIAKKGDLVVVFDSGSIQSDIEQTKVNFHSAEEELHKIEGKVEQDLLEATYAKKRSALLLEKAKIDASIAVTHISRYDYEKYQLDYEKSLLAHAKAKEKLVQTMLSSKVAIAKQKIKIAKLADQLEYKENRLTKMGLKAERTGPILYGIHPWTGEKIFVGATAQPGWKIAEIPSLKGMYIEAWVHEVDYQYLSLGKEASLVFDAYPNNKLTAKLTDISTQPESQRRWGNDVYFKATFNFKNTDNLKLLPGMSALLEFVGVTK
jgi:multidrug resistance efflux pump